MLLLQKEKKKKEKIHNKIRSVQKSHNNKVHYHNDDSKKIKKAYLDHINFFQIQQINCCHAGL